MVAIAFRFPAGRFHATPWGRHVNEADVEWPPSPWRILRALVATWHRKADAERFPQALLDGLVERLCQQLPTYRVPSGVRAHARHYMPMGWFKGPRIDTALVFDGFVRLAPDAELVAAWPDIDLDAEQTALLDALLRDLGFLGRAESWVEARRLDDWQGESNCIPSEIAVDTATGEVFDPVRLIAPVGPGEYSPWRQEMISAHGLDAKRPKRAQRRILATLPERLADTLRNETGDLHAAGWSSPPGARFVTYQRPYDLFQRAPVAPARRKRPAATTVRLALIGKPLPRIEDALRIGEIARKAAIKQAERVNGGQVPTALSGHDLPADNRHGHAFYLPEDADGDGHIDHILVHAPDGLGGNAVRALDRVTRLWERDGGEWQVLFEGYGTMAELADSVYAGESRQWVSVTPYLHPWYAKKHFGVAEQIARECRERGLPEPEQVEIIEPPMRGVDGRTRRPVHFRRFRNTRKHLRQPDTRGQFVHLAFAETVEGPLTLGFACHFGLGILRSAGGAMRNQRPETGS
jgi:CRISPR-associated protein Csb2